MARIERFRERVPAATLSQPTSVAFPFQNPVTPTIQRIEDRNTAIRGGTFNLESSAKLTEDMELAFQQAQRDAPLGEFDTEGFLKNTFDPMVESLAENAPNDLGARLFRETSVRARNDLAIRGGQFAAQSQGQAVALGFENARDSLANAVLSNPALFNSALNQIDDALEDADQVLSAQAVAEFRDEARGQIAGARVLGDIAQDPFQAMALLNSGEMDDLLSPSDKESLMRAATAEQRRRVLASEDAQKPTEAFREQSGRLANDLLLQQSTGTLTQQDIMDARPFLTRQDERTLINSLGDQITPTTDPLMFANLFERANAGHDITFEASNAFRNGDLSQADYVSLTRMVTSRPQPGTIFERTRTALSNRLQPGAFETKYDREGAQIRTSNALRDFDEWSLRNPEASDEQYWQQVEAIGERWSFGATKSERLTTLPMPMFFQGNRANPDLDETQRRINGHFTAKHNGDINAMMFDPDFIKEIEILQQWRDFMADSQ